MITYFGGYELSKIVDDLPHLPPYNSQFFMKEEDEFSMHSFLRNGLWYKFRMSKEQIENGAERTYTEWNQWTKGKSETIPYLSEIFTGLALAYEHREGAYAKEIADFRKALFEQPIPTLTTVRRVKGEVWCYEGNKVGATANFARKRPIIRDQRTVTFCGDANGLDHNDILQWLGYKKTSIFIPNEIGDKPTPLILIPKLGATISKKAYICPFSPNAKFSSRSFRFWEDI